MEDQYHEQRKYVENKLFEGSIWNVEDGRDAKTHTQNERRRNSMEIGE